MTLAGTLGIATCLLDVVLVTLLFLQGHGVGLQHVAGDLHRTIDARNHQLVAILEFDILVAAGIGQGLVEMDTDAVGGLQRELLHAQGVLGVGGSAALPGHLDEFIAAGQLVFIHVTDQSGATYVGSGDDTTGCLHHVGEALVLLLQGVTALKGYLTRYADLEGLDRDRAATHRHHIVGLERETAVAIELKAGLDGETEGLGNLHRGGGGLRIDHAAGHIDLHRGGIFRQTACLQDEVLDGHLLGILVGAGEDHLTVDGQDAEVLMLCQRGDEEDVLVLQGHIGGHAFHDALQVD